MYLIKMKMAIFFILFVFKMSMNFFTVQTRTFYFCIVKIFHSMECEYFILKKLRCFFTITG